MCHAVEPCVQSVNQAGQFLFTSLVKGNSGCSLQCSTEEIMLTLPCGMPQKPLEIKAFGSSKQSIKISRRLLDLYSARSSEICSWPFCEIYFFPFTFYTQQEITFWEPPPTALEKVSSCWGFHSCMSQSNWHCFRQFHFFIVSFSSLSFYWNSFKHGCTVFSNRVDQRLLSRVAKAKWHHGVHTFSAKTCS